MRPKNPDQEVWTGRRLGPENVQTQLGIDEGFPIDALDTELGRLLMDVVWLEYPFQCMQSSAIVDQGSNRRVSSRDAKTCYRIVLIYLVICRRVSSSLMKKSLAMREAGRISALGHVAAMQACKSPV